MRQFDARCGSIYMSFKKIRIATLIGGPSAEHEVSLKTGKMIVANLDRTKYRAKPIVISKAGKWPIAIMQLKRNFDLVFIAMHGEYGEDGQVQALLEKARIPFTGSGSRASALGMDKIAAAEAFKKAGLLVPGAPTALPIVVKPADRGSSVGVSIVRAMADLPEAIANALRYSKRLLVQQFIAGRELTCGILEIKGVPTPLPPTEIIPVDAPFFDFAAKYTKGGSREITPPNLPAETITEVQRAALAAHRAIGARGMSRTDMILAPTGELFVLEINTIPGMTATSLLPQAAAAAGITFPQLLDHIIAAAH